jgi:hypothetical protein
LQILISVHPARPLVRYRVIAILPGPRKSGFAKVLVVLSQSRWRPLKQFTQQSRFRRKQIKSAEFSPRAGAQKEKRTMGRDGSLSGDTVIGPDGRTLTLADLPKRNTTRWVTRRKAEVVAAVQGGLISLDDACDRYRLSVEEFLSWQHAIARYGLDGLRATHVQDHRAH